MNEQQGTFCENHGHFWQPTTSEEYRVCDRGDCRRLEHRENQQWVLVANAHKPSRTERKKAQRARSTIAVQLVQGYQQQTVLEACGGRVIVYQPPNNTAYTVGEWGMKEGWAR